MITQATSRQVEPDITVVTITGRLNLGNTLMSLENDLRKQIQNGARKIAFDLSGLDYIDSAGIGMLVGIFGQAEQAGGHARIAGAKGSVAHAFSVVHMERIMPLDEDLDGSTRHLAAYNS